MGSGLAGQLHSKEIWKNGMKNGLFEGWYKSGIKEYEENYKEIRKVS